MAWTLAPRAPIRRARSTIRRASSQVGLAVSWSGRRTRRRASGSAPPPAARSRVALQASRLATTPSIASGVSRSAVSRYSSRPGRARLAQAVGELGRRRAGLQQTSALIVRAPLPWPGQAIRDRHAGLARLGPGSGVATVALGGAPARRHDLGARIDRRADQPGQLVEGRADAGRQVVNPRWGVRLRRRPRRSGGSPGSSPTQVRSRCWSAWTVSGSPRRARSGRCCAAAAGPCPTWPGPYTEEEAHTVVGVSSCSAYIRHHCSATSFE